MLEAFSLLNVEIPVETLLVDLSSKRKFNDIREQSSNSNLDFSCHPVMVDFVRIIEVFHYGEQGYLSEGN